MDIKNKINNMDDTRREKLGEVIRFGIVGGLATVLQARCRLHPLTCGKLYDANCLPQPLRWSGARQTVGDDSYPLHLYSCKLLIGKIFLKEIEKRKK